jgi:peptidyl-prolyl cis-trans isomerase A (cyclophilin A)
LQPPLQKAGFGSQIELENTMLEKSKTVVLAIIFFVTVLVPTGCKSNEQTAQAPPPEQPAASAPAQTETPPPAETKADAPAAAQSAKPAVGPARNYTKELIAAAKTKEHAPDSYKVKFDTTRGVFTITVTRAWAPLEADRFYTLVKHHFFDNASFFRVVPNFVVQFGISPIPAVSSVWKHTELKDDPPTQSNRRGTIVFAQTGAPNSRTTQVFINLKNNSQLDHYGQGFAPFGAVDGDGMNVVEMMYEGYGDSAGPDQDQIEKQGDPYLKKGWPKLDYIKSATVVP